MALSEENCSSECQLSQTVLLDLFDLQAADEGEYQCVAESEAGTAERTITLKVQGEFCAQNYTQCHMIVKLIHFPFLEKKSNIIPAPLIYTFSLFLRFGFCRYFPHFKNFSISSFFVIFVNKLLCLLSLLNSQWRLL